MLNFIFRESCIIKESRKEIKKRRDKERKLRNKEECWKEAK
jgi:hypothetical protein